MLFYKGAYKFIFIKASYNNQRYSYLCYSYSGCSLFSALLHLESNLIFRLSCLACAYNLFYCCLINVTCARTKLDEPLTFNVGLLQFRFHTNVFIQYVKMCFQFKCCYRHFSHIAVEVCTLMLFILCRSCQQNC